MTIRNLKVFISLFIKKMYQEYGTDVYIKIKLNYTVFLLF